MEAASGTLSTIKHRTTWMFRSQKKKSLVSAVEQLKTTLVQSSFKFDRTESKGPYVLRVYSMSHIFNYEIVVELVHTHQDGYQVDADINNLCVHVLDGSLARATLEIRVPNQPVSATIVENILAKQFVPVNRSKKRIEKLAARGYFPISRRL